jgi:hypothetical protein
VRADSEGIVKSPTTGLVSLWPDQTPGGTNNLAQTTSSAQPMFVADGVNGRPTLHFDGGDVMGSRRA